MGIKCFLYGENQSEYEKFDGCVLSMYERNGYDDSDFYAVCWDEESQSVVDIEYDTTRAGGGGTCSIDATEEVIRKAYRYYVRLGKALFDGKLNAEQAKKIGKGSTVRIVRGRKIPQGTVGTCFWTGTVQNRYTYRDEERIGVEANGEKFFVPLEYAEVVDWESKLLHGKMRKKQIRRLAVHLMPYQYRERFDKY